MPQRPSIIGHHLIWTLYGHWLANDLRGSGSQELRQHKFAKAGVVHTGRKPEHLQPSRRDLKEFFRETNPLLEHRKFWLNETKRQAIGATIREVVSRQNYTVWACAVLSNHVHMVVRRHRDDALAMWHHIADSTRLRIREFCDTSDDHPVWSSRPYKFFLKSPPAIRSCIAYVQANPQKEDLPAQT